MSWGNGKYFYGPRALFPFNDEDICPVIFNQVTAGEINAREFIARKAKKRSKWILWPENRLKAEINWKIDKFSLFTTSGRKKTFGCLSANKMQSTEAGRETWKCDENSKYCRLINAMIKRFEIFAIRIKYLPFTTAAVNYKNKLMQSSDAYH